MFDKLKEDVRETLTGSNAQNDLRARLHADHSEVSALIGEFLSTGDHELAMREDIRNQIVVGLASHAQAEEEVVYSVLSHHPTTTGKTQHAVREHAQIDALVQQLKTADVGDPTTNEIVKELQQKVTHHVHEEETDLLPKAETDVGKAALAALIPQFNARKAELVQQLEAEVAVDTDADAELYRPPGRLNELGESDSRF
jgi:hemerythrin superfamily protein